MYTQRILFIISNIVVGVAIDLFRMQVSADLDNVETRRQESIYRNLDVYTDSSWSTPTRIHLYSNQVCISILVQGFSSMSYSRASFSKLNSQVKLDFPLSRFIQVEISGAQHVDHPHTEFASLFLC